MTTDNRHTPEPHKLEMMAQAIDDSVARGRKPTSAYKRLSQRMVGISTPDYVYQDRAKCIQIYRAMFARACFEIGQHPPQPISSSAGDARSAPGFSTSDMRTDRQCQPCNFLVEGRPDLLFALGRRVNEPK